MNEEAQKRIAECKRTKAKSLDLRKKKLIEIPAEINELVWLEELRLSSNQINEIKNLNQLTALKGLRLESNQINEIKNLEQLTTLMYLDLFSNQISEIKNLDQLTDLTYLNLSSNQISEIKNLNQLTALNYLYLLSNQIVEIKNLDKLTALTYLNLSSNQINEIENLGQLTALNRLHLSSNQIDEIKNLDQLTGLNKLTLSSNQISEIRNLDHLKKLSSLNLQNNKIEGLSKAQTYFKANDLEFVWKGNFSSFEDNGINLQGNPIKNPPIDVVQQGKAATLRYFEELKKGKADYLYEARLLIVGQGGAGKTSLKTKLLDVENPMPAKGDTTRGIEIETLTFKMANDKDFDLRIWDFGGQNIQHYAHQFFLSDSSLYALVHNEREQNTNFTYWLNIIEMLGKESPVIIVQNEVEEHSEPLKNIVAIRDRYPNVESVDKDKGTHQVNIKEAKTDKRFGVLKAHLQKIASDAEKLPHLKKLRPESFIKVRDKIEQLAREHYFIEWKEYVDICNEAKATNVELQKDYSITMSKLGTCLHFPKDSDLKDYVFLNPKWIIDALFLLLYNEIVITQKGKFCEQDCDAIWHDERYNGMHSKLIRLMENFELCYKINDYDARNRNYLVPQRLPASTASFNWKKQEIVRVRYQYEFIPSGILTRLTCRLHTDIDGENVWSDAVVFTNNKKDAHVYIKERFAADELWIEAKGVKRSELLNKAVDELDKIHSNTNLANLQVKKMLPCNCRICQFSDDPFLLEYEVLLRRLSQKREMYCDKSDDRIDIEKLIADTFEGGDKALIKLNAMHHNMTNRFDNVDERFDNLENQLGEFKFLIENFNDDYKEATELILKDIKSLSEREIGSTEENQQLIERMVELIEENKNLNDEQKAKVKQGLSNPNVEVKNKLIFGTPGIIDFILPISYKAEISISDKQNFPKSFKELKALLLQTDEKLRT